ncbi:MULTISPECIES: ADP-ribosylglycohydrolase family protein [unclassified Leptolyngbya]|uniref:ADP-ribosylglycohydrolase family protein n=1 Tax=unclassified Leptolyngbya TaxID=2650499 RepID=UPI001682F3BB|nr:MULTISPECIES: ADP-ribosylglycohydrolase family protein [unclassified Leptolyngbya]MBD1913183.1 ADP-ribosylglycohydrolase family protein [Leptolyngbya sp. FACHB-8]MBD2156703.1 ADP-ribosylglycohydrolase family protein [Leptolyngbya sp. FACHB-16]
MLLELAIGDAYGAGFEYASKQVLERNNLSGYFQHPRYRTRPGQYTDDTQMSLAIAEAIVADDPWTPLNLARRFVDVFHRDPREGYASRFYAFLQQTQTGEQFLAHIQPVSDRSGAAMRASPIGIFTTLEEVLKRASIQAQLTHNTAAGISAAQASALMTHYFLYNLGAKSALGEFLDRHVPGYQWSEPWQGEVGAKGWMSVRAAVTAVLPHTSLCAILQDCISFGGDVDTVATIALAAASCSQEVTQDLPQHLVDGLENEAYGRDYLRQLDTKLLEKVQR